MNSQRIPDRIPVSSPDLIGYALTKYHDGQIRIAVKFNGRLDETTLTRAVRLTFDAEPVIGCRFVERPFCPYWQRCNHLDNAFEFHTIDNSTQEKAICSFLLAPLNPFSGPQVKVGLLRADYDTLCIKVSHIVADGGASMQYLQLLSSIYRKLKKHPDYQPTSNLCCSRSSFQIFKHIGLRKVISSCTHISMPKTTWGFLSASGGDVSPYFITRRIETACLSRIRAYAKNHNVTIGDVLTTAYYRTLFEVLDPPENVPHALFIPVNLRKHIPGHTSEAICMLSASYFVAITRKKKESFEETLAKVHAAMESEKSKQTELGLMFVMEIALAPGYFVPRILGTSVASVSFLPEFSNIGVIDASIADFGDIPVREILSAGPAMPSPLFCLGSNTFNDEMTLIASICGTEDYRARVENFFDALVKELPMQYENCEHHIM